MRDVSVIAEFHRGVHRGPGVSDLPRAWGPFVLLEEVGSGSSGELYRAWDPDLRREVALKLLHSGTPAERLVVEGRNLASIRHPNVVTVYGVQVHEGRTGLLMEYLRGESLEAEARRRGKFSAEELANAGIQIGRALEAVHGAGVLHRDVKPENVVRERDGRLVLTDFGLGVPLVPREGRIPTSGTPLYLSREVLDGGAASAASDLYALGVTLYYLASGRHPFEAGSIEDLRRAASAGSMTSLARLRSDLPSALTGIVDRLLHSEIASSAKSVREELDRCLEAMTPATEGASSTRSGHWALLVGVLVLVGAAAAALLIPRGQAPETPATVAPAALEASAQLVRLGMERETRLASGDRVSPGEMLALEYRASSPTYVYVINEDDRGEAYLLFPQASYDTRNPLPPGEVHRLPGRVQGKPQAWGVSSAGGHEHFLVIASLEPLDAVERELARLPAPTKPTASSAATSGQRLEPLRGTGHLVPAPDASSKGTRNGSALDLVRQLIGGEPAPHRLWTRSIVLESVAREGASSP